jgi:serine/threonine protein kinase
LPTVVRRVSVDCAPHDGRASTRREVEVAYLTDDQRTTTVRIVGGHRFGRYEVVQHLASGGMAEVYLARSIGDGGFVRHLVVKAMRPSPGLDGTFARMFLDEARLAATLHHQHIAQVFDLGTTEDGSYYLVMEYVHGETVRNVMAMARSRSVPLPPGFGVAVASAVAGALSYAHERTDDRGLALGIVHRDVTPANVLVGQDGGVKLIDFGIAKAVARTANTQTGVVKGKSGYMAPEQVLNHAIDARTDVFALGIVLYELTTGERLFQGATDYEAAQKCVAAEVPRPTLVVRGYPRALEEVVLTALSREPGGRFASARAMAAALVDAAKTDGLDARPDIVERVVGALFGLRPEPWQRIIPTAGADDVDEEGTTERLPGQVGVALGMALKGPTPTTQVAPVSALVVPPLPLEAAAAPLAPAAQATMHDLPLPPPTEPMPVPEMPDSEPSWYEVSAPEAIELPERPTGHATADPSIRWGGLWGGKWAGPLGRRPAARWAAAACALGVVVGVVASMTVPDVAPVAPTQVAVQPPPPPRKSRPAAAIVQPPASSRPPVIAPAPVPLPAPVPALAPGTVRVSITTSPPDATVVIDGRRMGRTPFSATITPRGDSVWLKVRKRGHVPKKVKVPITPDLTWNVQLDARRR